MFYTFEFKGTRFDFASRGYRGTHEAVICDIESRRPFIETELIVHARKGRRRHPLTHTLNDRAWAQPNTRFIAILDEETYRVKCDEADAAWAAEKAAARGRAQMARQRPSEVQVEELPQQLQARIRTEDNGCWLWLTRARRVSLWKPERRKRVRRYLYGRVKVADCGLLIGSSTHS